MTGGEKIREARKTKNLTLRQLAKKIGINFTYLSKIENMTKDDNDNPTIPSKRLLIGIAGALDIEVDILLQHYEKPPTKVDDWARDEAFQEFYRASGRGEISPDEWRALKDKLRQIRNKKDPEGDVE